MIVVSDYKFVEQLLSSPIMLRKAAGYTYLYEWLGKSGLLLSEGDSKWKFHRKILTPTFHFKIFNEFTPIFEKFVNIFVEKLKNEIGNSSFNIHPYVTLLTLDIICETAMGTSVNAQLDVNSDYVKSVATMCCIAVDRAFNPLLMINSIYKLTPLYQREKRAIKILHSYVNSVITQRRNEFEKQKLISVQEVDDVGMKRKLNFLDILLQYQEDGKQSLTDQDIREEVDTFMFAGHDITASAISFTLYLIAKHPQIQEKILYELKENVENYKSESLSLRDLQNLKYLEAVIKESLRLYPSVPIYGRNLNEDVKIGDIIIPKQCDIFLFIYGIHRNPAYFPDPEEFIPERHLSENSVNRQPYDYLPFSAGPRNCIGQKFAMLAMKSVITTVLKRYELLPAVPKYELDIVDEIVLQSKNGINVRIIAR